jgi:hypothetical protein
VKRKRKKKRGITLGRINRRGLKAIKGTHEVAKIQNGYTKK